MLLSKRPTLLLPVQASRPQVRSALVVWERFLEFLTHWLLGASPGARLQRSDHAAER